MVTQVKNLICLVIANFISLLIFGVVLYAIWSVTTPVSESFETSAEGIGSAEKKVDSRNLDKQFLLASKCVETKMKNDETDFSNCPDYKNRIIDESPELIIIEESVVTSNLVDLYANFKNFAKFTEKLLFSSFFSMLVFVLIYVAIMINMWSVFLPSGALKINLEKISYWSVDAPPVLGIIGTLLAMVAFFASRDASAGANFDGFFDNFVFAASSTIVGGFVSIFNQFIIAISSSDD